MDVASTAFTITTGIVKFISEHGTKDVLQGQISAIVVQIQALIKPLLLQDFPNDTLKDALKSLNNILVDVDSRLRSWSESQARRMLALVNPWAMTNELKEDRQLLMCHYQLLTGAMQAYQILRGPRLLPCTSGNNNPSQIQPSTSHHSESKSTSKEDEVLRFWHMRIGGDLEVVKCQQICDDLASWLNMKLDALNCSRLLLRLDEANTGFVTLKTLQDLVRNGNLKEVIQLYTSDPGIPLLIWISDDHTINAPKVAFAHDKFVSVVQLASTSSAKAWIKVNRKFLLKHDNPSDLRFISDQCRRELNAKGIPYNNKKAGNQILKFIRDMKFKAPVLIYTSKNSLALTRYVDSYSNAGSIGGNYSAYKKYVTALASRKKDDKDWMKCTAEPQAQAKGPKPS